MDPKKVSVVILNYRTGRQAAACAKHLLQQTLAAELEIIIVDNHSQDDSIGYIRNQLGHHPQVKIVETPRNAGFGSGYNYGIRYAEGQYLLINNPVKLLQPDGVELLVAKLEAEPDIGVVSPKLTYPDGTARLSARSFPAPLDVIAKRTVLQYLFPKRIKRYLQLDRNPDEERDTDWAAGGCVMMCRDLFTELGGFDDRFFLFFEDTDLCRRAKQAGKRVVYYPTVEAMDRRTRLSDMSTWKMFTTGVGRAHLVSGLRYFWKWKSAP